MRGGLLRRPGPSRPRPRTERRGRTRPQFRDDGWRKDVRLYDELEKKPAGVARVDVWVARIDALIAASAAHALLSHDDWAAISQRQLLEARHSALAARIMLRLGLSMLVHRKTPPRQWRFLEARSGRLTLVDGSTDLNFSISHADDVIVVAVGHGVEVGVDVESLDYDAASGVVSLCCHPREQAILSTFDRAARSREFVQFWTHKEAYTKLLGEGHGIDFATLDCSGDPIAGGHAPIRDIHFERFYVSLPGRLYDVAVALRPLGSAQAADLRLNSVVGVNSRSMPLIALGMM